MKQRIKSASWMTRWKKILRKSKKREKDSKRKKRGLSELHDNMKCNNVCTIGIPEGEEEQQGIENLFEK